MNKPINQPVFRSFLIALCISAVAAAAFAQSPAFTYQGRLQHGGTNANGSFPGADRFRCVQVTRWFGGGTLLSQH
ncbi:MAG TPA: hypothetical protein VFD75_18440 [Pyrinomonadaceae bacterium]|nr:hypothetical protein [Pyrinomonadaceae bacterium]